MRPTGRMTAPLSINPKGIDKPAETSSEKEKAGAGTLALQHAPGTVLSENLRITRAVELNKARFIPGYPYGISDNKPTSLQSMNILLMRQIKTEEVAPQACSGTSLRQSNHLDNSSTQTLINLIKQGIQKKAKEYITNNPLSLATKDEDGNTALHLAVLHGYDGVMPIAV